MEEGTAAHAQLDPRRPETRMVPDPSWLEEPFFPFVERRQRAPQSIARTLRQRRDPAGRVPRAADVETRGGVPELPTECGVLVHLGLADAEAGRRALLAIVTEGRANEIADRLVSIRERGDDHRVLAARLGEEQKVGTPFEESAGGLDRPGQDDPVHARIGDERASDFVVRAGKELKRLARDARVP